MARQDRKNKPRVPITARLVADLITRVGADRIVTMDLHAGQIQGFFNVPVDNLYASPILLPFIKEHFHRDLVIVSPDAGGVPRARAYAKLLKSGLAMIDKRRTDPNKAEALNIIGEVEDKTAVILDDMVDTAGTLVEATRTLLERGTKAVFACVTHAVLSGPAVERIRQQSPGKPDRYGHAAAKRGSDQERKDHAAYRRQGFSPRPSAASITKTRSALFLRFCIDSGCLCQFLSNKRVLSKSASAQESMVSALLCEPVYFTCIFDWEIVRFRRS